MTTGGVPDGILSPPVTTEMIQIIMPTAAVNATIACTLLLRKEGYLEDRVAYGCGFEDFLDGKAKCIFLRKWPFGATDALVAETGQTMQFGEPVMWKEGDAHTVVGIKWLCSKSCPLSRGSGTELG